MRTFIRVVQTFIVFAVGVWLPMAALGQDAPAGNVTPEENAGAEEGSPDIPMDEELPTGSTAVVQPEEKVYQVGRSGHVMSDRDLESGVTIPQVLGTVPGAFVQETNAGAGSPLLRGRVGIENSIRIDGLRYGNASFRTGPNQYLNVLDPNGFSTGRVIMGPGSTQFGSGATGGALLLTTHSAFGEDWARLATQVRQGDRSGSMSVDGAIANSKGYVHGGGTIGLFGEMRTGGGDIVPGSDYQRRAARFGGGTLIGNTGWTFNSRFLFNELENVGRVDQLGRGQAREYDNRDWFGYVDTRGKFGDNGHVARIAVMTQETWEQVEKWKCDKDLSFYDSARCARQAGEVIASKERNQDRVRTVGGKVNLDLFLFEEAWDSTVGAEVYQDEVSRSTREVYVPLGHYYSDTSRGNFVEGTRAVEWSAYWMNEYLAWADEGKDFRVFGGSRLSGLHSNAPETESYEEVEYDFVGLLGEIGLEYTWSETWSARLAGATGFRPPNFQETTVVGDTGTFFEVPNPDLTPENIAGLEVGLSAEGTLGETGVAAHIAWVTDTIERVPGTHEGQAIVSGQDVRMRDNVGNSRIVGVEWFGETGTWENMGLFGDVSWIQIEIDRDGENVSGRREPPIHGKGGVFYRRDAHAMRLYSEFALAQDRLHPDDRRDYRICENPEVAGELLEDCEGSEGWATLNLSLSTPLTNHWDLHLGAKNMLDLKYRRHGSGMDAMGADWWGSIVGRF